MHRRNGNVEKPVREDQETLSRDIEDVISNRATGIIVAINERVASVRLDRTGRVVDIPLSLLEKIRK